MSDTSVRIVSVTLRGESCYKIVLLFATRRHSVLTVVTQHLPGDSHVSRDQSRLYVTSAICHVSIKVKQTRSGNFPHCELGQSLPILITPKKGPLISMKRLCGKWKRMAQSLRLSCTYCRQRGRLKLVMLLLLCSCICHVLILNFSGSNSTSSATNEILPIQTQYYTTVENQEGTTSPPGISLNPKPKRAPLSRKTDSFPFIHSNGSSSGTDESSPFVMVFPHRNKEKHFSQELMKNDKLAFWNLSEFLGGMEEFDGATCLQPDASTRGSETDQLRQDEDINFTRNIYLDSSWCRFMKREWSVHIRNTGQVQNLQIRLGKLFEDESSLLRNETLPVNILLQSCNIVQGPFLIRRHLYDRIGGLLDGFGKLAVLEFFIRSEGQLKIAKLSNCVWTPEITRVDRGSLEGSHKVPEYSSFANKHGILRIVTESRIEWTACVANWKLCKEKPYIKPRDLPRIAAPICCSVVLGQMLADLTWALTRLGLEYRIIYGTLLGAVRSQAIIPWTTDIDVALTKSAIDDASTFPAIEKLLENQYYVGNSFMGAPRVHGLMGPYIDVDTAPFFDGHHDLQGNLLFSNDIEEAVRGMLPVSEYWRERTYADLYWSPSLWMNGSSLVTINNQTFVTVKEVDYELTNWYGKDYRQPVLKGNWVGFSDQGTA